MCCVATSSILNHHPFPPPRFDADCSMALKELKTPQKPRRTAQQSPYNPVPSTPKKKISTLTQGLRLFIQESKDMIQAGDIDGKSCQLYTVLDDRETHGFVMVPYK